jgi:hypothetical protein
LTASLSSLSIALIDQFVLTHRINAPEASLTWFILRPWHFDEVAIQAEIVSNAGQREEKEICKLRAQHGNKNCE